MLLEKSSLYPIHSSLSYNGNGCEKWERLRERLRPINIIFLLFFFKKAVTFAIENKNKQK